MLDDTTPMCRFGDPLGRPVRTLMNAGKLVASLVISGCIDCELSTMNRMSRSRLSVSWNFWPCTRIGFGLGVSSLRALQAHRTGSAAARTTQRQRRQENGERPVITFPPEGGLSSGLFVGGGLL